MCFWNFHPENWRRWVPPFALVHIYFKGVETQLNHQHWKLVTTWRWKFTPSPFKGPSSFARINSKCSDPLSQKVVPLIAAVLHHLFSSVKIRVCSNFFLGKKTSNDSNPWGWLVCFSILGVEEFWGPLFFASIFSRFLSYIVVVCDGWW